MIKLKEISKNVTGFALGPVDIEIAKGEFFVLLGASGSGKSMLMEIIAGITNADNGKVIIEDKEIQNISSHKRNIGILLQDGVLFPHLNVMENIAYSMRIKGIEKKERTRKVNEIAGLFNLKHILNKKPADLSGGEKQRTALARVLLSEPNVLLLDEPLNSLDNAMKKEVKKHLKHLHNNGQTIVYVTHDFDEAITLAQRIGILENGQLTLTGTPEEIFHKPETSFTASFAGAKNMFKAKIYSNDNSNLKSAYITDGFEIKLYSEQDGEAYILIRSEDIFLSQYKPETSAVNNFLGTVSNIFHKQYGAEVVFKINNTIEMSVHISEESLQKLSLEKGSELWLSFKASAVKYLTC